ncbi:hypothetical protein ACFPYI_14880 [Halomarina salina]|uniref:Uncharacterized protein n=1 Tax=Halomarina salina TaxID=1872699 RepID=A0ABD5RPZ8_9EURY|nr:hypothetical protein [Halomarina salina]
MSDGLAVAFAAHLRQQALDAAVAGLIISMVVVTVIVPVWLFVMLW